ncbi:hypothetical protein Q6D67_09725 [Haliea sp. E1-2-M8]|uniref:hypothetical protein n=1 Tax=Haliea sp. E1-2-M8 TaxID=3064706 RepID=UPI00271D4252|nr:hypothetical protein [Haliea sp. E1-2-M8]MDO8861981.1 hypothetical protein [Haliea sp. E1-2-M8]
MSPSAVLAMVAALTFLYVYPLQKMTSWTLPLTVLMLGWVVYQYLEPLRLLQRHAYLTALTRQESWVRRWFWRGFLLRVRLVVTALAAAVIALLFGATIRPEEWLVVLASVPVFLAVFAFASRLLRTQLATPYHFPLTLRWACWTTLGLLVIALTLWQVVWLEVPASYQATLPEVLGSGFQRGAAATAMPLVGQALGIAYALDAGIWHLMQVTTTVAGANRWVFLAAWAGVLLWSALKVAALWAVLLGAVTLAVRLQARPRQVSSDSATLAAFALVVASLGIGYLGFTRIDLRQFAALVDPCRVVGEAEQARLVADANARLLAEEQAFSGAMNSLVDSNFEAAYTFADQGVERFLDWNFSIIGQYQQLGWLLAAQVSDVSAADQIGRRVEMFVHEAVALELAAADARMQVELQSRVLAAYAEHEAFVRAGLAGTHCLVPPGPDASFAGLAEKSWVGGGAVAGLVARRAAAGLGAMAVSRVGMRRVMAGVATRAGARAATAGQAGGTGALCGPMAWACIPALAGTVWLATDKALNEVDEALNRARMRDDLLEALDQYKTARKQELTSYYAQIAGQVFSDIEHRQGEVFNLYRDGGRAPI